MTFFYAHGIIIMENRNKSKKKEDRIMDPAVILDVVFIVILVLGLLIGSWRGFIKGVCKLAGTIFALFVAFTFCNPFKNTLENWFGMTTAIAGAFGDSQVGITAASWISIAISFVLLFIIIKLLSWLLGKIGTELAEKSTVFGKVNRLLGAILGLAEGVFLVFLLLTICYWIPSEELHSFIAESSIVGRIFEWDGFRWAAEFQFLNEIN